MEILEPTLNWNYNTEVSNSYIITIKDHKNSELMGQRCLDSCNRVGQKAVIWDAFDGTGEKIKVPEHARNTNWLKWLKLTNYLIDFPVLNLTLHLTNL